MSRFGLEITEFDNMYATQFEDGTHIMQWCDIDRTCASIARFSEQDADTYRKFANMSLRLLPRETK